jgi:hypothetical protein
MGENVHTFGTILVKRMRRVLVLVSFELQIAFDRGLIDGSNRGFQSLSHRLYG